MFPFEPSLQQIAFDFWTSSKSRPYNYLNRTCNFAKECGWIGRINDISVHFNESSLLSSRRADHALIAVSLRTGLHGRKAAIGSQVFGRVDGVGTIGDKACVCGGGGGERGSYVL
jgi:hypothetical protein